MQDELTPLDGAPGHSLVSQIALDQIDFLPGRQVFPLAAREVVCHADGFATPQQLFYQMRPDEAGPARNQVVCHGPILR